MFRGNPKADPLSKAIMVVSLSHSSDIVDCEDDQASSEKELSPTSAVKYMYRYVLTCSINMASTKECTLCISYMQESVCACVCVCMGERVCVCVCVRVCERGGRGRVCV